MRIVCLTLIATTALFAGWEELKGVPASQKIEVSIKKGDTAKGAFVSASDTAIVVREITGERSIARGEVRKIRVADPGRRTRNVLIGTAIGIAAGLGISLAACPGCANEGHGGKFAGAGIGIGAAIGAAAGLLPGPWRTIKP